MKQRKSRSEHVISCVLGVQYTDTEQSCTLLYMTLNLSALAVCLLLGSILNLPRGAYKLFSFSLHGAKGVCLGSNHPSSRSLKP